MMIRSNITEERIFMDIPYDYLNQKFITNEKNDDNQKNFLNRPHAGSDFY